MKPNLIVAGCLAVLLLLLLFFWTRRGANTSTSAVVAWIKRPEKVMPHQTYDWSCELGVPDGGLLESESQIMFRATEAGYTNEFAYEEHATWPSWSGAFAGKRFYVKLRDGHMHGRIS